MNESRLKKNIEEKYSMDMETFLIQKTAKESLFNYEIAEILGISSSEVRSLIKRSGIKRGCVFKRQFKKKYGPDALKTFDKMISDPETNLADVGRYFGFSREYARQAYKTLYGMPYTKVHEDKKRIRKKISNSKWRTPVPEVPSVIVSKLISLGFNPEFSESKSRYVINVNGNRVLLRSGSSPVKTGKQFFFQISLNRSQNNRDFDFIICLLRDQSWMAYYIIPVNESIGNTISLPGPKNARGKKYWKYLDAWHLIKPCSPAFQNSTDRTRKRAGLMPAPVFKSPVSAGVEVLLNNKKIRTDSEISLT